MFFWASPTKIMQNHYEISSKTLFWTQNIQNRTKSPDLDMSGPAKSWSGHVRTWKVLIWSCPDLKSHDLDMSGPVQEDKYLLQNSGNIFTFWDFTPFHFLWPVLTSKQRKYFFLIFYTFPFFISKFIIFYKILCFYDQIYPIALDHTLLRYQLSIP